MVIRFSEKTISQTPYQLDQVVPKTTQDTISVSAHSSSDLFMKQQPSAASHTLQFGKRHLYSSVVPKETIRYGVPAAGLFSVLAVGGPELLTASAVGLGGGLLLEFTTLHLIPALNSFSHNHDIIETDLVDANKVTRKAFQENKKIYGYVIDQRKGNVETVESIDNLVAYLNHSHEKAQTGIRIDARDNLLDVLSIQPHVNKRELKATAKLLRAVTGNRERVYVYKPSDGEFKLVPLPKHDHQSILQKAKKVLRRQKEQSPDGVSAEHHHEHTDEDQRKDPLLGRPYVYGKTVLSRLKPYALGLIGTTAVGAGALSFKEALVTGALSGIGLAGIHFTAGHVIPGGYAILHHGRDFLTIDLGDLNRAHEEALTSGKELFGYILNCRGGKPEPILIDGSKNYEDFIKKGADATAKLVNGWQQAAHTGISVEKASRRSTLHGKPIIEVILNKVPESNKRASINEWNATAKMIKAVVGNEIVVIKIDNFHTKPSDKKLPEEVFLKHKKHYNEA